MRTSQHLTEDEIMRCITDSGPTGGLHLAALERQKWGLATAEQQAAANTNTQIGPAQAAAPQTSHGLWIQLTHWLNARFASMHQRPTSSTTR